MTSDKEPKNFLFRGQAGVLIPIRRVGQFVVVDGNLILLEYAEQAMLAGFRVTLGLLRRSMALSRTAINWPRRPNESMAPLLISDSSTRLFSSRRSTFSQNS